MRFSCLFGLLAVAVKLSLANQCDGEAASLIQRSSAQKNEQKVFVYVHIPRTGGFSFLEDMKQIVGEDFSVDNEERCFDETARLWKQNGTFGVLFRSPLRQVLSQYMMCKMSSTNCPNSTDLYGKLDEWIDNFLQLPGNPLPNLINIKYLRETSYLSYNPWNMQTRYFTQKTYPVHEDKNHEGAFTTFACHFVSEDFEPNAVVAEDVIRKQVQFVGITDLYVETLCLLHFQVHGNVPKDTCFCGGPGPTGLSTHDEHGLPPYDIDDLPEETLQKMAKFVKKDLKVFSYALNRFEKELRHASKVTGVDMVCAHRFNRVRGEIERLERA